MRALPCHKCLTKSICMGIAIESKNKYINRLDDPTLDIEVIIDRMTVNCLMKLNNKCETIRTYLELDNEDNYNYYDLRSYYRNIISKDLK